MGVERRGASWRTGRDGGYGHGTSVTVAVLTYRRPEHLLGVLPLICREAMSTGLPAGSVRVLVVDNSPDAGAAGAVAWYANDCPVRVDYAHEPRPGIPAARNRALAESRHADLLVFIDDDERPEPGWLPSLLRTLTEHEAAAVVGAIVPCYESPPSAWVRAGRFFERRRYRTGTEVAAAATSNLLLDLRVTRSLGLAFDEHLGATGADDTMFTRALVRCGGAIVWCDEAVVVDLVPPARARAGWVLVRALRSGNSWALVSLRLADTETARAVTRCALVAGGLGRVAGGAALMCAGGLVLSNYRCAHGARSIARGAGMTLGAFGLVYLEYLRPDLAGTRHITTARALQRA